MKFPSQIFLKDFDHGYRAKYNFILSPEFQGEFQIGHQAKLFYFLKNKDIKSLCGS